ncbi:hypothetical protein CSUI_007367 [Cystoisospora suis]|uniref:Transmembrane protein n=1 Tax=Cystoisospora suis TaxID=483139 RepID=A0A2C6KQP0_9APIC|nr:hypothetical protein CSUI_007367 [Cystoisospora suis]
MDGSICLFTGVNDEQCRVKKVYQNTRVIDIRQNISSKRKRGGVYEGLRMACVSSSFSDHRMQMLLLLLFFFFDVPSVFSLLEMKDRRERRERRSTQDRRNRRRKVSL